MLSKDQVFHEISYSPPSHTGTERAPKDKRHVYLRTGPRSRRSLHSRPRSRRAARSQVQGLPLQPEARDTVALLSNCLLHRNATYCRLHGDGPEQHQHYDGQQQWKSDPKIWTEPAPSVGRPRALACRVALHRRAKTCALRVDWKLTITASSDHASLAP